MEARNRGFSTVWDSAFLKSNDIRHYVRYPNHLMRVRFNPKLLSSKGSFSVLAILTGILLLFLSGLLFADPAEARWRFLVFGLPGLFLLIRGSGNTAFGKFTLLIDVMIAAAIFFMGVKTAELQPPPEMPDDYREIPPYSDADT